MRPRSVVTVDVSKTDFSERLIKSMVRQSNHTREEFYGATKKTARKASVAFRKTPSTPELDVAYPQEVPPDKEL